MARIRSVHPGFFTDEDIVEVSIPARLLLIGLGVESDDKGIFPWKAKTIKMRIFPADSIDVSVMLDELQGEGLICRYDVGGKSYGAIRNFRKHQRPKSPNDVHPCTPEILNYVGLNADDSGKASIPDEGGSEIDESKCAQFPQGGGKSIQMEDGGCKMDGLPNGKLVDFDSFWKLWPSKVAKVPARKEWSGLNASEREMASRHCVSWFNSWRKSKPNASDISAAKYLSERRWTDDGFVESKSSDSEVLDFYANVVLAKKPAAASTVSAAMAGRLLIANRVTREQLLEAGVAI